MSSEHEASGTQLHVEQHDALPDVLEHLNGHQGESLTLVVADHSPILLTATEFRTLKDHADRQQIQLRVQTGDSLRLQLASMFGLAAPAPRPEEPEQEEPDAAAHSRYGSWRNARRPRHRVAGQPPEQEQADPPAQEVGPEDPIAVSRRRRSTLYGDSVAWQRGGDDYARIDDAGLDYIEDDEEAGGHTRAWLYGRIAAAVLLVLAVVIAALWYWFPAVEVDITLREAEISTGIVYSVAAPDAQLPSDASFAVEASEQSAEVPFRIEIPASDVIREPDGTASGPVLFRNVSGEVITLDEGTELTTVGGQSYLLQEPVEVPAGDIDAPGEAEGTVMAAEGGEAGNLDPGALTGKVPDIDVYYSNLSGPIEGGSDREFPMVAEADVEEAERAVQEDLRSAAADGWREQLDAGMAIVGPSVAPGDPEYTIEGEAGDQRESVVVSGTVPVTGLVYSLADVEEDARSNFEVELQDQVPPGYELDASTIELGEPEVIAEAPENVEYRVSANAVARAMFDEGAQEGLRERMAGSSIDEARAEVDDTGAIEMWEMSLDPGWWPDRMPQTADRITLDIQSSGGPAGDAGTPAASPAPDDDEDGA